MMNTYAKENKITKIINKNFERLQTFKELAQWADFAQHRCQ